MYRRPITYEEYLEVCFHTNQTPLTEEEYYEMQELFRNESKYKLTD